MGEGEETLKAYWCRVILDYTEPASTCFMVSNFNNSIDSVLF